MHGGCCDIWSDQSNPGRLRDVGPVRPYLADLVVGGRGWCSYFHSFPFALGSEPFLELDKAPIDGSRRTARVANRHSRNSIRGFLSRAHERRSVDVSLRAISCLDGVSLRPARILGRHLSAFDDRRGRNRTREGAFRPGNTERFAPAPANFSGFHGIDDVDLSSAICARGVPFR